jgi:hypothetical protein
LASIQTGQFGAEALFDIPLNQSAEHQYQVRSGDFDTSIGIEGLPRRAIETERADDPHEQWLQWQVQRYLELGDLSRDHDSAEAATNAGVVRRTWRVVDALWKESGAADPTLSLIVKLSRNKSLNRALRQIAKSPRKQLVRVREPQRIDRIQELDAACLRAYSRAPGRTPVEKAGARQSLIAVVRRENVDLLENQLTRWVLTAIIDMAASFLARHQDMKDSSRYREVADLQALAKALLRYPALADVSPLAFHPGAPSYCLQSETRYRQVWSAYQAIRHERRIFDDAWRWHMRQWASTSRLLMSCLLRGLPGWREERTSTPYFREEAVHGVWSAGPSVPGPFKTTQGTCHVLDSRDPRAAAMARQLGLPPDVEAAGTDWILVWPERMSLLAVWASVGQSSHGEVEGIPELDAQLERLTQASGWTWKGVAMIATPQALAEHPHWIDVHRHCFVLHVPAEIHHAWNDLEAAFDLVVEAAAPDVR